MAIIHLSDAQLAAAIGSASELEKGRPYYRRGDVLELTELADDDAVLIESSVKGSRGFAYDQIIRVIPRFGGAVVKGACSCPVGRNCKHVAATLLAWRDGAFDPFQLSSDTQEWLTGLAETVGRLGEAAPGTSPYAAYVLNVTSHGFGVIQPFTLRLGKRGEVTGKPKALDANLATSKTPPKHLRASDLRILSRIAQGRRWGDPVDYALLGAYGAAALAELAETGRCHWESLSGPTIKAGPPVEAGFEWRVGDGGAQRLVLRPSSERLVSLNLAPPWYLDPDTATVGPLSTGLPDAVAVALASAPALPPAVVDEVRERLAGVFTEAGLSAPLPIQQEGYTTARVAPRPVALLTLAQVERSRHPGESHYRYIYGRELATLPVLKLVFDYDGTRFRHEDKVKAAVSASDRRVRVLRDMAAEKQLAARLVSTGLHRLDSLPDLFATGESRAWLTPGAFAVPADFAFFVLHHQPALVAEGWTVEMGPDFPLHIAQADEEGWGFEVKPAKAEGDGRDWFDLELGVRIDGRRVDILPALLELVKRLPPGSDGAVIDTLIEQRQARGSVELPLADGRILSLPLERIAPILKGMVSVWGVQGLKSEGTKVSRWDAAALADLQQQTGQAWSGGEQLLTLGRELRDWPSRAPTPVPAEFKAQLRPYQQAGLDWLQMLGRCGFGGLLADDMGLGKTVQTLALLSALKAAGRWDGPALVVAPTSVLPNWAAEAAQFAPDLDCLVLRGKERAERFGAIADHDLVVTSYPLLARDRAVLTKQSWGVVILDEGQTIRNPVTAAAQAAFSLKAGQRIVLSGTPVENHLGDVWSLMNFLNPGMLGDAKSFVRRFRTPIEKNNDAAARARLGKLLQPFLLRRTKDEVAGDLPPKTEIAEPVELTAAQAELYESTRLIMQTRVRDALVSKGLARSSVIVLDALLKLRQVCCDPRLVKGAGVRGSGAKPDATGSAKLQRLLELVEQLQSEGRRALVFSQFTSMLELIRREMDTRKIGYAWLTGDTQDRATPVRRFQAGQVSLFLISLKAGGSGLNLTAADTVILYDPWWNPAVEAQAIDRAHRIGQSQPVFVHRLIASGTIEEKMLALQARKRELASALWSEDGAGLGALTEDDIQALFGPAGTGRA